MRILFLFIMGFFLSMNSYGQKIDSLKIDLESTQDPYERFFLLDQLFKAIVYTNTDQALEYAEEMLVHANDLDEDSLRAASYRHIGVSNILKGNYKTAIENYELAIEKNDPNDVIQIANMQINIAICNSSLGNDQKAISTFIQSLENFQEAGYKPGEAISLTNIAKIFNNIGQDSMSLDYYKKSLRIKEELRDTARMTITLFNIASIHFQNGRLDSAEQLANRSFDYAEQFQNKRMMSSSKRILGSVATEKAQYTEAIKHLEEALEYSRESGQTRDEYLSLAVLARATLESGKPKLAKEYASDALSLGIGQIPIKNQIGIYKTLYQISEELEEWQVANLYKDTLIRFKDSLYDIESAKEIANLDSKYQLKEKQKDNDRLVKENEQKEALIDLQRYLIIASILALALLVGMASVWYRGRQKQKKLNDALLKTQAQLIQSEKMASLGTLTAGVAHEINNPINFISSGSEALAMNIKDLLNLIEEYKKFLNDPQEERKNKIIQLEEELDYDELIISNTEILDDIKEGTYRVVEIVDSLRTYSRTGGSQKTEIDLHEIMDSTLRLLNPQIKENIRIEKNYADPLKFAYANGGELGQVFMNLLSNAIHAIEEADRENAWIKITTKNEEPLIIIIEDNGCGMSQEIIDHLFDPFYTTKEIGKGQGLGMSISLGIVEAHGGSIKVESKEGEGSTVRITFPSI